MAHCDRYDAHPEEARSLPARPITQRVPESNLDGFVCHAAVTLAPTVTYEWRLVGKNSVGLEVGTGAHVAVPLRHLVVTGRTQESGKTTQRFDPLV